MHPNSLNISTNYYPFGMIMPRVDDPSNGKFGNLNTGDYRFGFNGMEMDNELKGNGNSYDFGARIYDPRLGRFLSVDPLWKIYPFYSPYSYIRNNPIFFIDLLGEGDPLAQMKIRKNRASNLQGLVRSSLINGQLKVNSRAHQGFDLEAKIGTEVLAVSNATIYKIVNDEKKGGAYGKQIVLKIANDDGSYSFAQYSHLSRTNFTQDDIGKQVKEGAVIGETGISGNASANEPHLHFELRSCAVCGKGLSGRLDPNEVLDTKFFSQDPDRAQSRTGVVKVEVTPNGLKITNQNIDGTEEVVREPLVIEKIEPKRIDKLPVLNLNKEVIKPVTALPDNDSGN